MGSRTVGKYLTELEFQIMQTETSAFLKKIVDLKHTKMKVGILSPLLNQCWISLVKESETCRKK